MSQRLIIFLLISALAGVGFLSCKEAEEPECTPYNPQDCEEEPNDDDDDDDDSDGPRLVEAYQTVCQAALTPVCTCWDAEGTCGLEAGDCQSVCASDCSNLTETAGLCQQEVFENTLAGWDRIYTELVECLRPNDCSDYFLESFEERVVSCAQIQSNAVDQAFIEEIYRLLDESGCLETDWPSLTGFWARISESGR